MRCMAVLIIAAVIASFGGRGVRCGRERECKYLQGPAQAFMSDVHKTDSIALVVYR